MKYVVLSLFFSLCAFGAVKHKSSLKIVEQSVIHPTNCPDDPLATPCTIVRIVVENRAFEPQTAVINCGDENDEAQIVIPARTRLTIDEELDLYAIDPSCHLK